MRCIALFNEISAGKSQKGREAPSASKGHRSGGPVVLGRQRRTRTMLVFLKY